MKLEDSRHRGSGEVANNIEAASRAVTTKLIIAKLAVFVVVYFVLLSRPVCAEDREMVIPVPQSAYSQAVKVRGGTLVFLSGIGPTDEKGALVAPGDFPGQVRATWEHMRRIMTKAGGSLDDIVTMTVYTTERRWGEIFTDMRKEVFHKGYPSSAFMEARKLLTPGALLEIQAIAVLND
jgi:2-iminobutanoate/2-iminopropanoate deaminase